MEKNRTHELILSSKLILIGLILWVIKVQYFTFFWIPESDLFANIGLEILGTSLILVGIFIISRVYPFIDAVIAKYILFVVLVLNVLNFFLYSFPVFKEIHSFAPVLMSLVVVTITKLMKHSLNYFSNSELASKWDIFGNITFFGFTLPFYLFISAHICSLIEYERFMKLNLKVLLLFIPYGILVAGFFIYFITVLFDTLKFLNKIKEQDVERVMKVKK